MGRGQTARSVGGVGQCRSSAASRGFTLPHPALRATLPMMGREEYRSHFARSATPCPSCIPSCPSCLRGSSFSLPRGAPSDQHRHSEPRGANRPAMTITATRAAGAVTPALFAVTVFRQRRAGVHGRADDRQAGAADAGRFGGGVEHQPGLLPGRAAGRLRLRPSGPADRARSSAQVALHLAVLVAAALVLPLKVSGLLGDRRPGRAGACGCSASWRSRSARPSPSSRPPRRWFRPGTRAPCATTRAGEPYALYAASNLGSLLALLAYPVIVEPNLTLRASDAGWSRGYGVFVLVIAAAGRGHLAAARRAAASPPTTRRARRSPGATGPAGSPWPRSRPA